MLSAMRKRCTCRWAGGSRRLYCKIIFHDELGRSASTYKGRDQEPGNPFFDDLIFVLLTQAVLARTLSSAGVSSLNILRRQPRIQQRTPKTINQRNSKQRAKAMPRPPHFVAGILPAAAAPALAPPSSSGNPFFPSYFSRLTILPFLKVTTLRSLGL